MPINKSPSLPFGISGLWDAYQITWKTLHGRLGSSAEPSMISAGAEEPIGQSARATTFKSWWDVELAASQYEASDPDRADKIYLDGIRQFPRSSELLGNYALFLKNVRQDVDGAEALYKRAIEADPKHGNSLCNYALFLEIKRKDMKGAERYYKRALDANPTDAITLGNYADFLETARKNYPEAKRYYELSLKQDPNNQRNKKNYERLLTKMKKP
ncbi:MAG: tetratricopeptide repeat protein [Alphaproteobacteria bacterium]|nr:tetratricopeptide repeat protein [Alphaproteobacteria bacterium]